MTTRTISLLDDLQIGWAYPYRSKKAHLFSTRRNTSFCGKHKYIKPMLPTNSFWGHETDKMCRVCGLNVQLLPS